MSIDPVSLAITAALTAAQMAMQASKKIEGPRLDDLSVNVADYGTPLNYFVGTRRFDGCPIFFAEPLTEIKQTRKTKGGKFTDYKYSGTWAIAIADHEIAGVSRVWMDKHLVYDVTGTGPITPFSIADGFSVADNMRFYLGTETQEADPRMQATVDAAQGAGSCPAYRGVSYIFFENVPLDKFGNRIPQVNVEAMTAASPHYPYQTIDISAPDPGLAALVYSPDGGRFLLAAGDDYQIWDSAARAEMIGGTFPSAIASPAVANNGNIYGLSGSDIVAFSPDGLTLAGNYATTAFQAGLRVLQDGRGVEHVVTLPAAFISYFWTFTIGGLGAPLQVFTNDLGDASYWTPRGACVDSYGDVWLAGSIAGFFGSWDDLFLYRLVDTGARPGSLGFLHLNHGHFGNGTSTPIIHSEGKFFVHWGAGRLLVIDDEAMTLVDDIALSDNAGGGGAINFRNFTPGARSIWIGFSEISLTDGSTIRAVAPFDWKTEDSNVGPVYDITNNALISHPQFSSVLTWRYLDRVSPDTVTLGDVVLTVARMSGFS